MKLRTGTMRYRNGSVFKIIKFSDDNKILTVEFELNNQKETTTYEYSVVLSYLKSGVWTYINDENSAPIICECGGDKTRCPHSSWCPKY